MEKHLEFMRRAIALAKEGRTTDTGGPFGAVIVRDGKIVAEGYNKVNSKTDCTQHAELAVIQMACKMLKTKNLSDCILYTSCEPCLMCLGACYWAHFQKIYYGVSAEDTRNHGFVYSDMFFNSHAGKRHAEFKLQQLLREEALLIWK